MNSLGHQAHRIFLPKQKTAKYISLELARMAVSQNSSLIHKTQA